MPNHNNDDELFTEYMKKSLPRKEILQEDKDLFKNWIKNEPSSSLLKNQKKENLSQEKIKIQDISTTIKIEDSHLLDEWLSKNISIPIKEEPSKIKPVIAKKTIIIVPTIDLHGFTITDALEELKRFMFSLSPHIKKVRIIHGKGMTTGKKSRIKEEVRSWLSYQKNHATLVQDFSYEKPENGGHGATVVWLR